MSFSPKRIALIVAGGSGSRMQSDVPKQFLLLDGKPVLMHTVEQFEMCDERVVVLPETQITQWETLCVAHSFAVSHRIVSGGSSRFQSVLNGLNSLLNEDALVAIHDGVRPLISKTIIDNTFETATKFGNGIAAVKAKDSIRILTDSGISNNIARDKVYLVQTPQTFQLKRIKEAYISAKNPELFTDDASVMEAFGEDIHLVEGDYRNIKITTPEDLVIAQTLIKMR
jgi:2-C-methyl-D-erythritol 4-phosphate cytidylyltransferase